MCPMNNPIHNLFDYMIDVREELRNNDEINWFCQENGTNIEPIKEGQMYPIDDLPF